MITITLSNQKGGVAKTTTALALCLGLSQKGYKVLAIDLDPQCNLCFSSGIDTLNLNATMYDVFSKTASIENVIQKTEMGYDIVPGGLALASADMEFTRTGREYMLSEAMERIKSKYDFAIIDTAPTLGILAVNAFTASAGVVIPMAADAYSLQGLAQLHGLIESTRKYCNKDLKVYGLLLTKYNGRQTLSKVVSELIDKAASQLDTLVFKSTIRESVAVRESVLQQSDFFREAPNSNATIDYNNFVNELLEVIV